MAIEIEHLGFNRENCQQLAHFPVGLEGHCFLWKSFLMFLGYKGSPELDKPSKPLSAPCNFHDSGYMWIRFLSSDAVGNIPSSPPFGQATMVKLPQLLQRQLEDIGR